MNTVEKIVWTITMLVGMFVMYFAGRRDERREGEIQLKVLAMLVTADMFATDIVARLGKRSRPLAIYSYLARMEDLELITGSNEQPEDERRLSPPAHARRVYRITDSGRRRLDTGS